MLRLNLNDSLTDEKSLKVRNASKTSEMKPITCHPIKT